MPGEGFGLGGRLSAPLQTTANDPSVPKEPLPAWGGNSAAPAGSNPMAMGVEFPAPFPPFNLLVR